MSTRPNAPADTGSTWMQTAAAVLWSFFGVRRSADLERDSRRLKPVHVIVTGIVAAALFVGLLVLLVNWVVGSGVAT
jgi:hypothetical protein